MECSFYCYFLHFFKLLFGSMSDVPPGIYVCIAWGKPHLACCGHGKGDFTTEWNSLCMTTIMDTVCMRNEEKGKANS